MAKATQDVLLALHQDLDAAFELKGVSHDFQVRRSKGDREMQIGPLTRHALRAHASGITCFLMVVVMLSMLGTTHAQTQNSKSEQLRLWDDPGWKRCLADFRKKAKLTEHGEVVRYVDGKCASYRPFTDIAPVDTCYMAAVGPSKMLSSTKVEVKLECVSLPSKYSSPVVKMVCTNKKNHYISAMTSGMPTDPRCDGFPDLLAVNMERKEAWQGLSGSKNEANNSTECKVQINAIRRLENHPSFDENKVIRKAWAREVEVGSKMGCKF